MWFDRYFREGAKPDAVPPQVTALPSGTFAFCHPGIVTTGHWAEIYRIAHERTVEALRPTSYDRALRATTN